MAPRSVCKYYLRGSCSKGKECKFRHNMPGTEVVQERPYDEPGTMTAMVDGRIKATFSAGAVPANIAFLLHSRPALRVESVDSTLGVAWTQATRSFYYYFFSKQTAERASQVLDGAKFMGINLHNSVGPCPDGTTWVVQVSNITEDAKPGDLLDALLSSNARPFASGAMYNLDTPNLRFLEDLLKSTTTCKITNSRMIMQKDTHTNNLKCRVGYKFDGCTRLDGVVRQLNGKQIEQFGRSKIFVAERINVQLSVEHDIGKRYAAKLKWGAFEIRRKHGVRVHIDDTTTSSDGGSLAPPDIRITLQATDRTALKMAKATFDGVLMGEMCGPLSHAPLHSNQQTHRIRLGKTTAYRYALQEGLKLARDAVGRDAVDLDDNSNPPAVIVRGDTTVLRKVQKCLREDGQLPEAKKTLCPICLDKVDDIIRIAGCGHFVCPDCFASFCMVDDTEGKPKFPSQCFQSGCNTLLKMEQLCHVLNKDQFQLLLSQAVADHFSRNAAEYTQCSGPDCPAYYRISQANEQHICPTCFTVSCRDCKVEFHAGETCAQYNSRHSEHLEKLEEWIKKEGAKHCKNCNAVVQKLAGYCDNMQCHFCKAHFCWTCMEIAPTHEGVYKHLIEKHGGYFADERELDERMGRLLRGDDDDDEINNNHREINGLDIGEGALQQRQLLGGQHHPRIQRLRFPRIQEVRDALVHDFDVPARAWGRLGWVPQPEEEERPLWPQLD